MVLLQFILGFPRGHHPWVSIRTNDNYKKLHYFLITKASYQGKNCKKAASVFKRCDDSICMYQPMSAQNDTTLLHWQVPYDVSLSRLCLSTLRIDDKGRR